MFRLGEEVPPSRFCSQACLRPGVSASSFPSADGAFRQLHSSDGLKDDTEEVGKRERAIASDKLLEEFADFAARHLSQTVVQLLATFRERNGVVEEEPARLNSRRFNTISTEPESTPSPDSPKQEGRSKFPELRLDVESISGELLQETSDEDDSASIARPSLHWTEQVTPGGQSSPSLMDDRLEKYLSAASRPSRSRSPAKVSGQISSLRVGAFPSTNAPPQKTTPEWVEKLVRKQTGKKQELGTWSSRILQFLGLHKGAPPATRIMVQTQQLKGMRKGYEVLLFVLIFLNALFVAWELQYYVRGVELPVAVRIISLSFAGLFTFELLCRINHANRNMRIFLFGYDGRWNSFDLIVVILLWIEQFLRFAWSEQVGHVGDLSIIRVVWFCRLGRIIRMMQVFENLREIRLLLQAMRVAVRSLFWILFFSSIFVYFFAIYMADGTLRYCHNAEKRAEHADLCRHFGTFWSTFLTMYEAVFGGLLWGDLLDELQPLPAGYFASMLVFLAFGIIVLTNLVTGILVEVQSDGRRLDLECMMAQEEQETKLFIENMQAVFNEIDTNESGAVSKDELELALEDRHMSALLRCLKLETIDAELLFDILDTDHSGSIDIEEFIVGCIKMKGHANAINIVRLQLDVEQTRLMVAQLSHALAITHLPLPTIRTGSVLSSGDESIDDLADLTRSAACSTVSCPEVVVPEWSGTRIAKSEERAMLRRELHTLRNQIGSQYSTWVRETTGETIASAGAVNMYDVNFNWVSPLTLPAGVILKGLQLQHLQESSEVLLPGGRVTQEQFNPQMQATLALGEIVAVRANGLEVKVLRGKFLAGKAAADGSDIGMVKIDGRECGVPSEVTLPVSMSYKELISSEPKTPDWYTCHWWGEPIFDFLAGIDEHSRLRGGNNGALNSYWICAFANSQHDLGMELTDDPEKSSFRRAMLLAQGVLLILDEAATPFQRIWCDYELYRTVLDDTKKLDIVTVSEDTGLRQAQVLADLPGESAVAKTRRESRFPIAVLAKGICVKLEEGQATVSRDKARILHYMRREVSDQGEDAAVRIANRALNSFFAWAAWPQAVKRGVLNSFASPSGSGTMALHQVTRLDDGKKHLALSMAHFDEVGDSALGDLAQGLPPSLLSLSFSFEGCSRITDRGLKRLAHGLQKVGFNLQDLQLDFLGCKRLTDIGLENLARSLPQDLQRLRLDFAKCHCIGFYGVTALARNLPGGLKVFSATFKGTQVDRNFHSASELRKFMRATTRSDSPAVKRNTASQQLLLSDKSLPKGSRGSFNSGVF